MSVGMLSPDHVSSSLGVVIMVVIMVVISCLTMTAQLGDGAATSPLPWLQFLGYSEKSPINQRSPIKRVINHL